MRAETDERLWGRATAGDSDAFGIVWDRHHQRVLAHAIALGSPPRDAEDVTATAFLELWRRRGSVRFVDGSLLPWLLVTTHYVHRNAARARRRYRALISRLPPPREQHVPPPGEGSDPRLDRIRVELAKATPKDATLLAMTALEGFTVREAAVALGLTEPAAKMRLSRLRRRITTHLEPLAGRESQ